MSNALFPEIVVNGEVIPPLAIATEAQNHHAPKGKPGLAWRKAAQALAIRSLMLQEAARRGIECDPLSLGKGRFETDEEAMVRGLLEDEIAPDAPSDEAIHALWAKEPGRFRAPPLWEASHILISADPTDQAATESAHRKALALTKTLLESPKEFTRLAAIESDCGSKTNGGALGQLTIGDTVPPFEAALRDLPEGAITAEPVQSPFGWHVIRMDACTHGEALPFDVVKPRLKEAAEKAAWTHAARDFTARLLSGATITGITMQEI
ncbi:MAG: peptidyl-prolyl cis-trans isomerase C [Paracoccaceae bacterium]|jgi:peptidyl-prolyl cis-trans isomerase C